MAEQTPTHDVWDAYERDDAGNYLVPSLFGSKTVVTPTQVEEARRDARARADRTVAATFARPAFRFERPCAKCGYGASPGEREAKVRFTIHAELVAHGACGSGEAMIRTCRRCEYMWSEQSVDATEGRTESAV